MTSTPAERASLTRQAGAALQAGRFKDGRVMLERIVATGETNIEIWMLLALACRQMGDAAAHARAVDEALRRDGGNLFALIWKGDCLAAARDEQAAIGFYERALRLAHGRQLPRDVSAELERASAAVQAATTRYRDHVETFLAARGHPAEARSARFEEMLDILTGEKRIYYQQPSAIYFPQLPQRRFYERAEFDWASALEARTAAIGAELDAVMAMPDSFHPQRAAPARQLAPGFPGPGDNPDLGFFPLWENGEPVTEHIARCPDTFDLVRHTPLCDISPRAPSIAFARLGAGGRLPAHNGMINARLICHLPLRASPGCGIRVGNEVRAWHIGQLLIFDDTIEHEMWNDSGEDLVTLRFDIWRPELGEDDHAAVQAIFAAADDYAAGAAT